MGTNSRQGGTWLAPVLLGAVLGPAAQLQQAALWGGGRYLLLLAAGCALPIAAALARNRLHRIGRVALWLLAATAITFATTGLRSVAYSVNALDPALEGRDLRITGVVAAMPQRDDGGTRFRFEVEDAKDPDAVPVRLPPQLLLGWYNNPTPAADGRLELQRQSADLRPGERWLVSVRLKAPHGNLNPNGFDYELWLWEQGLQATGYVRAGPRDAQPQRLARTWQHPVEQARHAVREAILQRVADRRWAGVLAALVVGDQAAIERADWDIFRATGVAHLMSISGLHVTMFAWAAAALIGALWRRSTRLCLAWPAQHAALAGGIALAAAYAVFSGWG
ncbi:ComEC/Rec2 family competence protein, partial [Ramlibacter sp.]|uniref:ComEC/Rec2 family competence protein n=1 Tax=Ramlibacter sp. TaxID=1917967 RepID=UPI0017CA2602